MPENGSERQAVSLSTSGDSETPKIDLDDWINQKARAFEKRLSESGNYFTAFLMDPLQTLAREGLLEGATDFSMTVKQGSLAKLAWGQDLYRRDPLGVISMAAGGAGGVATGALTVKVEVAICVTILGRRFCWSGSRHV
jgi:hypothetical protein